MFHRLQGIEIFPGVGTPVSKSTRYGATFIAFERGRVFSFLFGWVNYSPIFFKPSSNCTILGGRWWMISTERLRLRSLLYGAFEGGRLRWNKNAKLAEISVSLRIRGDLAIRQGSYKTGELEAVLNHHPFPPSPPRISGILRLFS